MGQLSAAVQGEKGAIPGNTRSVEQVKGIETKSGRLTEYPMQTASTRKPCADRHERGDRHTADTDRHD